MSLIDFEMIESNCRVSCARECVEWFINNLEERKKFMLTAVSIREIFNFIYNNDEMFHLFIFQRLQLITIDFEMKGIVYNENPRLFNVNLMNEVF